MDLRVAAYAVVVDGDDRILLAHWNEGRRAAWTMPGGGLEDGEDPERAVRREVREKVVAAVEHTFAQLDVLVAVRPKPLRRRARLPAKPVR